MGVIKAYQCADRVSAIPDHEPNAGDQGSSVFRLENVFAKGGTFSVSERAVNCTISWLQTVHKCMRHLWESSKQFSAFIEETGTGKCQ